MNMVNRATSTDRRQFLSAGALITASATFPVPHNPASRRQWDQAVAQHQIAAAALKAFEVIYDAAYEARAGTHEHIPRHIEAEFDRLCDVEQHSRFELMDMPAPDARALRWKLDHLLEADWANGVSNWSCDYIRQTRADMSRLLGDA